MQKMNTTIGTQLAEAEIHEKQNISTVVSNTYGFDYYLWYLEKGTPAVHGEHNISTLTTFWTHKSCQQKSIGKDASIHNTLAGHRNHT